VASIERTAYPRFKGVIGARELDEVFTPTVDEIEWAHKKAKTQPGVITLIVLLKSFQRLGYFPRLGEIPASIVDHTRGAAGLEDDVTVTMESRRTMKRHRAFIRERLGIVHEPTRVAQLAERTLRSAAQAKDNPADLINATLEELIRARCELPGYTTLDRMAAAIRSEVNGGLFGTIAARPSSDERARIVALLAVDPVTRRSDFDRLKQPAARATVSKLKERLAYLSWLDSLGKTEAWLAGVPPTKISHFAGEARVADAADMRRISDDKQLAVIISLLHIVRMRARDDVVAMFCKRIGVITKRAKEQLVLNRERHRADAERLMTVFGDILGGVREVAAPVDDDSPGKGDDTEGDTERRVGRMVLATLATAGGVTKLSRDHEEVAAHHGNNHAPLMERFYSGHRAALFTLLEVLHLEPTTADRTVLDAVDFIQANRHRTGESVPDHRDGRPIDLSFAAEMWHNVVRDRRRPGSLVRHHLEVCVFSHLAAELRSGDVAVLGSESYANMYDQMLQWDDCAPLVADYCAEAGIPATAGEFVASLKQQLTDVAERVDRGYPANADLVISDDGIPVLKRRRGKERSRSALVLEKEVLGRLPEWGLLDILARTAHWAGWHRHLGPASGSDPKITDALGRYVLLTFTYGANLGPAQVSRHMRGRVSTHELLTALKHATPTKIGAASADVINEFVKLDLTRVWGDGRTVGTDGTQIDTWDNNLLAETSEPPREKWRLQR
jgi:hypothetical protein